MKEEPKTEEKEQPCGGTKAKQEKHAVYTTSLATLEGQKFVDGKVEEKAPLRTGMDGFVYAEFSDGVRHVFDVPNLVLETLRTGAGTSEKPSKAGRKKKKKGAASKKKKKVLKKPSQQGGMANESAPPPAPEASELAKSPDYGLMYYKNAHTIGIRQKFAGKQQIMCFGGKKSELSSEALRGIGHQAVEMLKHGMPVFEVKEHAQKLALQQ